MTDHQDRAVPVEIYRRADPGVDPPTIALGLDIERRAAEGDVVIFIDDEAEPSRVFEVHRLRGAFRVSHGLTPPRSTFASAQACIREGWAMVDALQTDAEVGLDRAGGAA